MVFSLRSLFKQDDSVNFHLEHACTVLSTITTPITSKAMSKQEVQNMMTSFLANNGQKQSKSEKPKGGEARMKKRKQRSTCNACGERGHWANDPECGNKNASPNSFTPRKKSKKSGQQVRFKKTAEDKEMMTVEPSRLKRSSRIFASRARCKAARIVPNYAHEELQHN